MNSYDYVATQKVEFLTRSRFAEIGVSKNFSPRHYADWAHSPKGFQDRNHAGECHLMKRNEYLLILSDGRRVVLRLVTEPSLRESMRFYPVMPHLHALILQNVSYVYQVSL